MKIIIQNTSEFPIYAQIEQQIIEQILDGSIKAGTVLPSIRKLANELGVSVITTTRAYSELEQKKFVASVQGKGTIVLDQDKEGLKEKYQGQVRETLKELVTKSKRMDLEKKRLHDWIEEFWRED